MYRAEGHAGLIAGMCVYSGANGGGGNDLAAIMAARRRKVDASLLGDDDLDTPDIDSKGRGRVKRNQEAMDKV